jgi:hypothetical protein
MSHLPGVERRSIYWPMVLSCAIAFSFWVATGLIVYYLLT